MKLWAWLWMNFWKSLFFTTFHDPIVWNHDFSWHFWKTLFFMNHKSFFMTFHTRGHPVVTMQKSESKKNSFFIYLFFPQIFLCQKTMWQAILECRWARTCEARVLNLTASEASQLRNNVATEKQSKFYFFNISFY